MSGAGTMALALAAGTVAGWLHFAALARVTALLLAGRLAGVALQVGRLALLAGFLVAVARFGAGALVASALGIWLGRAAALRRAG